MEQWQKQTHQLQRLGSSVQGTASSSVREYCPAEIKYIIPLQPGLDFLLSPLSEKMIKRQMSLKRQQVPLQMQQCTYLCWWASVPHFEELQHCSFYRKSEAELRERNRRIRAAGKKGMFHAWSEVRTTHQLSVMAERDGKPGT